MKKIKRIKKGFVFLSSILFFCTLSCKKESPIVYLEPSIEPEGTALIITGAGGRISHEIALLERLHELGELEDVKFISGTSAGSILALALNAILDPKKSFDWEDLKEILFNLKQEELLANPRNDLPVDTRGAWNFFDTVFSKRLEFNSLSKDLFLPTCMTSVRLDDKSIARVSNVEELNSITDRPVEGLMTSISIPVAFPSIRINGVDYVDGGLLEDTPYSAVLEYQIIRNKPFKKIIIVSYQGNTTIEWNTELRLLFLRNKREMFLRDVLEASGFALSVNERESFLRKLKTTIKDTYPEFASRTVVYLPNIEGAPYFPILQFDGRFNEGAYNLVRKWALKNNPVPLNKLVNENDSNTR